MVTRIRLLLDEEFSSQLQSIYGIQPGGEASSLDSLGHLGDEEFVTACVLRQRIDHLSGGEKKGRKEAVSRVIREQAFTVLNRFAALRLAEARKIVQPCVGRGYQSDGFRLYLATSGSSMGENYERYRSFLLSVFDELALDLGLLFDRFSPQALLFPREPALSSLFEALNQEELSPFWEEDETIGWVYQYFNSPEERKAMRQASGAPRDSRELAVRNQFFTPRYVVRFLADNTLGRLWYEMTRGETVLKDRCAYLVRRPKVVFLGPGEQPQESAGGDGRSQEELLREPEIIPHRPLKDPREIRLLDPACGSMHFGLYAFDLYEAIYAEAWDRHPELLADLRSLYPERERFLEQVPELIIRHNIHGIDIDPRAVQIAGLSLWLRAHRSYQALGLAPGKRPTIRRANIACAEPMPGEADLLKEFTTTLKPILLGQLVQAMFERMKLAGEAGSLLKIEEEIRGAVAEAHAAYLQELRRKKEDAEYLPGLAPKRAQGAFDFSDLTEEEFWEQAEERILASLHAYAERVENGGSLRRRLFSDDAARGFAFVDLCRRSYDVVLMNPPFGESAKGAKAYIQEAYPRTKNDLYAAFVESFLHRLAPRGMLGAITSRTGFFLSSFQKWREEVLLKEARPTVFADLGFGVLDAMVETAAYCLERVG
jgi:hypothetical protein